MRQYAVDLIKRINELCRLYSNYLSIYCDSKLNVLVQNNSINIKLYNSDELIDEFEIKFDDKEKDMYMLLCINILNSLYDKIKLFNGQNIIYNRLEDSNISMVLFDDYILDVIINIICSHQFEEIYDEICNKLVWRFYPKKMIRCLDERINISRKLIRLEGNV